MFSYQLVIHNKAEWVKWEDSLDSAVSLPRDIFAGNMIIPTLESIKYQAGTFRIDSKAPTLTDSNDIEKTLGSNV